MSWEDGGESSILSSTALVAQKIRDLDEEDFTHHLPRAEYQKAPEMPSRTSVESAQLVTRSSVLILGRAAV